MVITLQLWVDADLGVVFCTSEVVRVSTGQAAIARVTAGLCAAVRIPVVGLVVFPDECSEVLAVSSVMSSPIVYLPGADCLIVHLHIFFLSASLIDGENTV